MKHKNILLKMLIVVLVVAILSVTLCACLKIGLKENNVVARLEKHGATVKTALRSAPPIENWANTIGISIDNIIYASYVPSVDNSEDEQGGENADITGYELQELYIIYANDKKSGDWVEEHCKDYIKAEENADLTAHWNVYRNDNIILVGDYRLLAVARQY